MGMTTADKYDIRMDTICVWLRTVQFFISALCVHGSPVRRISVRFRPSIITIIRWIVFY